MTDQEHLAAAEAALADQAAVSRSSQAHLSLAVTAVAHTMIIMARDTITATERAAARTSRLEGMEYEQ